jgi:hypothetical protein
MWLVPLQRNDAKKQDEICLKHPQQGVRNHLVELVIEETTTLNSSISQLEVLAITNYIVSLEFTNCLHNEGQTFYVHNFSRMNFGH